MDSHPSGRFFRVVASSDIRLEIKAWRDAGYAGASTRSRSPSSWWFDTEFVMRTADVVEYQDMAS